jgi:hypothetical protein
VPIRRPAGWEVCADHRRAECLKSAVPCEHATDTKVSHGRVAQRKHNRRVRLAFRGPPERSSLYSFMGGKQQVLRFAVGSSDGPRSRTWRLWVPDGKSDVYASSRRLSASVKVSMHEPGPSRYALTSQWVKTTGFEAPEGEDERMAKEWNRPRTGKSHAVRPLTLVVPWSEVMERPGSESEKVHWTPSPGEGQAVQFDVVYVPVGMPVTGHPGARSTGTTLVGQVLLANGERVFVASLVRDLGAERRSRTSKSCGGSSCSMRSQVPGVV